jgi:hypothetical protein
MNCSSLCGNRNCNNCFNKSFASHEKSEYLHDKTLNPLKIYKSSHKKYEFDCDKCYHVISVALNNVTCLGRWCSFCTGHKLCDDDSCLHCFNNSFARHEKSKYWSSKNDVTPRQILKNCCKTYLFECEICKHEFSNKPMYFATLKGCPFCAVPSKRVCDDINCNPCFNRSFASVKISLNWSDKNNIQPRTLLKYSTKKYWFKCKECNHEYQSSLSHVTNGTKCPYCAINSNCLCDDQDCIYCFNKSFASHEKAKYWSILNKTKPRDYTKCSGTKHLFKCEDCNHIIEKGLNDISRGYWCSLCINKTEKKLYKWLLSIYNDITLHKSFDWCIWKKKCYYDFVIESKKIIVELDGQQHFKQVLSWRSPDENQEIDIYKMKKANENGYSIIRIFQMDVFNDKNDWKEKLQKAIDMKYEFPQNIYITSGDHYDIYIEKMNKIKIEN